jgi:hypothetical protein
MTIGIYKLVFNGTNKVYVGQSGCIEKRYNNHVSELRAGDSSIKLQGAYTTYGEPTLVRLAECSLEELDSTECYYIKQYDSIDNGFNAVQGGHGGAYGIYNTNSKFKEEDYHEVLFYLAETNMSYKEIEEITGVSNSVIMHISSLTRHFWLAEAYPVLYSKLEAKASVGNRRALGNKKISQSVVSPTGELFEVSNITRFAKEHGLSSGPLSALLSGKTKSCKGWTRPGTELHTTKIVSPDNIVYTIPYRGVSPFAEKHGLTKSSLHDVLSGRSASHKGWTRYKADA